jgi:hypothetical protein
VLSSQKVRWRRIYPSSAFILVVQPLIFEIRLEEFCRRRQLCSRQGSCDVREDLLCSMSRCFSEQTPPFDLMFDGSTWDFADNANNFYRTQKSIAILCAGLKFA